MSGEITIRRAIREDCPRLMELVRELAEFEKAPSEVTVGAVDFERSGFGPSPVWWAFVAEVDGVIAGFALYYIRYSTWKGECMYLEDIYVTQPMRGHGIGTLLFDRLLEEASGRNMARMVWQVLDWNKDALGFYSKYGTSFDPQWVNCSKELQ